MNKELISCAEHSLQVEIEKYEFMKKALEHDKTSLNNRPIFGGLEFDGLTMAKGEHVTDEIVMAKIDAKIKELKEDKYTTILHRSFGGDGVCIFVKINASKESFLNSFLTLEEYYFDNYSVAIDASCKDLPRLRFISYDPDIYVNPNGEIMNCEGCGRDTRSKSGLCARCVGNCSQIDDRRGRKILGMDGEDPTEEDY